MDDVEWDVRTTPPWLRGPLAALYVLLALYLLSGFHFAMRKSGGSSWLHLGQWKMFTVKGRKQAYVEFEVKREGEWQVVDPSEWFPTRWESGLRMERYSFRNSKGRNRILAASACYRSPEPIEAIRVVEVRYRVKPGQPNYRHEREVKHSQNCSQKVALPNGKILDPVAWRAKEGR